MSVARLQGCARSIRATERGAVPNSGTFSLVGWPCTDLTVGILSFGRPINANELAVWIFGDALARPAFANKQCLGTTSRPPELGKVRGALALILPYDYLPYGVVGLGFCGNRMDARDCFVSAATPNNAH